MRWILAVLVALSFAAPAAAAQRTVTLALDDLWCPSCAYIVKRTLASLPGVEAVDVSYDDKRARVTYDDAATDTTALTEATARVGFPSRTMTEEGQ